VALLVSGCTFLGVLLLQYQRNQADAEVLRLERVAKKKLLANEPIKPAAVTTQFRQSEIDRVAAFEKNQAGDFLSACWSPWFDSITAALGGDASVIEFRAEWPNAVGSSKAAVDVMVNEMQAKLQLEVKDDAALRRVLLRMTSSEMFLNPNVESAVDSVRNSEKFLTVKMSVELKVL
jgi:hypothetical protein